MISKIKNHTFFKNKFYLFPYFPIIFGIVIYIFFRSNSLMLFKWLNVLFPMSEIEPIREYTLLLTPYLPDWFLFSLPDGLWMFSFVCFIFSIWGNKLNFNTIFWITFVFLISISHEFGQLFNYFPGTFDIYDITFYLLGALIPILLFTNLSLYFKSKNYEKLF